jgi:NAD(P)-dependent dehydrogenase (short-subunit alcohol dehydrogenase family)
MEQSKSRVALITGANRGLGFEVCRQLARLDHTVILTSRDPAKGQAMVQRLKVEDLPVVFHPLDVSAEASIAAAHQFVAAEYGRLDVLVNNAGVYLDEDRSVMDLDLDILRRTLETNTFGALRMCQVFIPLMKKHHYGRVVNVSSTMGQHARMKSMSAAYRLSKDALNALTQMIADSIHTEDVLVNSCHPGWVRTDMGGTHATISIEQGADTIVWLATLPRGGPSGKFFENRQQIDW